MAVFVGKCQHGQTPVACIECCRLALADAQDKTRELLLQLSDQAEKHRLEMVAVRACVGGAEREKNDALRLKDEMANHAVRLRVCLMTYGKHSDRCALFPMPSGKDCDCGLEANIQAVPGDVVPTPDVKRLCAICKKADPLPSGLCDGCAKSVTWPDGRLNLI